MFVLSQKETYPWPVVYEAAGAAGRFEKSQFTAEFRRLSQSRLKELHDQGATGRIDDEQFCEEVLVGWSGIKDAQGEDFPDTPVNRRLLFDLAGMTAAIVRAYLDSVPGAPRKN